MPFQIDNEMLTTSFNFMLSNVQRIEAFHDLETSYAKLLAHIKIELDDSKLNQETKTVFAKQTNDHNSDSSFATTFSVVLKDMYHSMVVYREAVRMGDIQVINKESETLQNSAQRMFLFYEFNQVSDKENAANAKQIVDQYNLFINYYGQFISYPPGESRMSITAQQYAKKAEDVFNSLMVMILKMYNEGTES